MTENLNGLTRETNSGTGNLWHSVANVLVVRIALGLWTWRNTCMVQEHYMTVLLTNHISAFCIGIMIGREYSHMMLPNHTSLSLYKLVAEWPLIHMVIFGWNHYRFSVNAPNLYQMTSFTHGNRLLDTMMIITSAHMLMYQKLNGHKKLSLL